MSTLIRQVARVPDDPPIIVPNSPPRLGDLLNSHFPDAIPIVYNAITEVGLNNYGEHTKVKYLFYVNSRSSCRDLTNTHYSFDFKLPKHRTNALILFCGTVKEMSRRRGGGEMAYVVIKDKLDLMNDNNHTWHKNNNRMMRNNNNHNAMMMMMNKKNNSIYNMLTMTPPMNSHTGMMSLSDDSDVDGGGDNNVRVDLDNDLSLAMTLLSEHFYAAQHYFNAHYDILNPTKDPKIDEPYRLTTDINGSSDSLQCLVGVVAQILPPPRNNNSERSIIVHVYVPTSSILPRQPQQRQHPFHQQDQNDQQDSSQIQPPENAQYTPMELKMSIQAPPVGTVALFFTKWGNNCFSFYPIFGPYELTMSPTQPHQHKSVPFHVDMLLAKQRTPQPTTYSSIDISPENKTLFENLMFFHYNQRQQHAQTNNNNNRNNNNNPTTPPTHCLTIADYAKHNPRLKKHWETEVESCTARWLKKSTAKFSKDVIERERLSRLSRVLFLAENYVNDFITMPKQHVLKQIQLLMAQQREKQQQEKQQQQTNQQAKQLKHQLPIHTVPPSSRSDLLPQHFFDQVVAQLDDFEQQLLSYIHTSEQSDNTAQQQQQQEYVEYVEEEYGEEQEKDDQLQQKQQQKERYEQQQQQEQQRIIYQQTLLNYQMFYTQISTLLSSLITPPPLPQLSFIKTITATTTTTTATRNTKRKFVYNGDDDNYDSYGVIIAPQESSNDMVDKIKHNKRQKLNLVGGGDDDVNDDGREDGRMQDINNNNKNTLPLPLLSDAVDNYMFMPNIVASSIPNNISTMPKQLLEQDVMQRNQHHITKALQNELKRYHTPSIYQIQSVNASNNLLSRVIPCVSNNGDDVNENYNNFIHFGNTDHFASMLSPVAPALLPPQPPTTQQAPNSVGTTPTMTMVVMLQQQINIKDQQLDEQSKQLAHKELFYQQQLAVKDKQLQLLLEKLSSRKE